MTKMDDQFFDRADEYIRVANQQLSNATRGEVSASMRYSQARFDAWVSAAGWNNAKEMEDAKAETIEYFVERYKTMLSENLDDYIKNFDQYMNKK